MTEFKRISDAANYIKKQIENIPSFGVVLGTGINGLDAYFDETYGELSFDEIPNFPISSVKSHPGKLSFGKIGDKTVVLMHGRVHYYEGFTMQEVVRPIRILKLLGIETLLMSNASGGLNDNYKAGDIVMVKDHINLMPDNPLRGPNIDELGVRFPDMSDAYSKKLRTFISKLAERSEIHIHQGVYSALAGPNLETKAEYKYLKEIGADLIGMSTVPEVIAAVHAGIEIGVLSIVSNECNNPELIEETTIEDVIKTVKTTEPKINYLLAEIIRNYEL